MGIKRHKPEEIVTKLRQVEVLAGQGVTRVVNLKYPHINWTTFLAGHP